MKDSSDSSDSQKPSLPASILLCAVLTLFLIWLRLGVFTHSSVGIGYGLPIVLVGWTRRPKFVWAMSGVFAAMAIFKWVINFHSTELSLQQQILSFALLMADLFVVASIVVLVINREGQFRARGEVIHRREEELKMSNEGLVERQQTMEVLLKLSRALTVGLNRKEIVTEIARTIRLLLGASAAIAVWESRGQNIEVTGYEGFGAGGPEITRGNPEQLFAGVVMLQQGPVALNNVSQLPEVKRERPHDGDAFSAMLGAPLKAGSEIIGALVVYSGQARSWTASDISLVGSLAAQTSISIAATKLVGQLEDEHRELQTIVDAVPFGILRTNAHATRLVCNPAAAAMLGFPEVIDADSKHWPPMKLVGPKGEIPQGRDPLLRALRGEVTAAMEMNIQLSDGEVLTTICNAAPIRDRSGAISGAISAFVDVSALKSLREEVDRRRKEADDVSLRKSRFLTAVAHDVRNPANAIALLAELLRKSAHDPAQSEEIPEIASELEKSAVSMVSMVTDVLELSRLDLGRIEFHESDIELGKWLDEQCKQYQAQAGRKGLEFSFTPPEHPVQVKVDKVRLARLLGILVNNAIKFTEKGKVEVDASVQPDRTLRIDVTDTGVGIPPEKVNEIFDEFAQLKSPLRQKLGGTGMSLAIAKRLVEILGGKLEVASEPAKGSTFSFTLPPARASG
jgi:signal transduction histidine kinase/GAF domain-containing protein